MVLSAQADWRAVPSDVASADGENLPQMATCRGGGPQ